MLSVGQHNVSRSFTLSRVPVDRTTLHMLIITVEHHVSDPEDAKMSSIMEKDSDEDGIRTHACRAQWISSPSP